MDQDSSSLEPVPPEWPVLAQAQDGMPDRLARLEAAMRTHPDRVDVPPARHFFARGVYVRELRVPAGMLVLGGIHKHSQVFVVLSGEALVLFGDGVRRVKGGDIFETEAGVQRAAHALVDTVFLTAHGTHERDIERVEAELVAWTREEYLAFQAATAAAALTDQGA